MGNLLRYALGLQAGGAETVGQPQVAMQSVDGLTYLTLTFRQWLAAVDLEYVVEVGDSLGDDAWSPGGMLAGAPIDNGDGTGTVTYRDEIPLSTTSQRFMRLRVARQ